MSSLDKSKELTEPHHDTICAVATAAGRGGVGIVRVSGTLALNIAEHCLKFSPRARHAHYCDFFCGDTLTDKGIALFFPGPNSFTGEDVLELQGHGGPVVLDMLLEHICSLGARIARPGEFSERAFLNDKLDLAQAEAIADLIDASSRQAAKQALNSLQGAFSKEVNAASSQLTDLRIYVESAIDFPEEEIDFLNDGVIAGKLAQLIETLNTLLKRAEQGSALREGMNVVLAGRPNAGKSTLLNALAGREVAIVTQQAGTTRDILKEHIILDGMPLHVSDTAGIRDAEDEVEKIGVERAWKAVDEADRILLLVDASNEEQRDYRKHWPEFFEHNTYLNKLTVILNKCDLAPTAVNSQATPVELSISAKAGIGLDSLSQHLRECMGLDQALEGGFSARRRHIEALQACLGYLNNGRDQLAHGAGELLAEDLRLAQEALGSITGKMSPDELLGHIFSSFCIGK